MKINSLASPETKIPPLEVETHRDRRREYVLMLNEVELASRLSSNHKRNIRKAQKLGVQVGETSNVGAIDSHLALQHDSMSRRRRRGESTPQDFSRRTIESYVSSGAGKLFQASLGEHVLSSIMILLAEKGAYYQSAGSSPEGMSNGASHALIHQVCERLKSLGMSRFSLGGVNQGNVGLDRFKTGFGAVPIDLDLVTCFAGQGLKRRAISVVRGLRSDPAAYVAGFLLKKQQYFVFSADPSEFVGESVADGLEIRKLTDDELKSVSSDYASLRGHHRRAVEYGFNDAYGAFLDGRLAHISWLISAEHDQMLPVRNVKLRAGEVEITHAHTLEEYRGRGIYMQMIRHLCRLAADGEVNRVYMLAAKSNRSSVSGIHKAGLTECGEVQRYILLPRVQNRLVFTKRGHRKA